MYLLYYEFEMYYSSDQVSNSRAFMPANPVLLQFSWKSRMQVVAYALEIWESPWILKKGLQHQFNHLFSFHIPSSQRQVQNSRQRWPPVSQSPIPQCGFIIQFYIFHVASTFLSSGGPQILSNLIFLFPSLFDLIEKIKSSWKTQLPFNSLLIFTGGELKNDSFAAILILIGNSFSSNFKIITKIHSLLCQKEKGVRGWIFKLSRSFLMIYVLYVSWFIAKVTKVEIFW